MAFRDRKKSSSERERERREERRKALSERLGSRPDQPGRSESEREESRRRREAARAKAAEPKAEKPKKAKAEKPAKPSAAKPAAGAAKPKSEKKTPKRRIWQRRAKPEPVEKPRRPGPEKPKADKSETGKPATAKREPEKPTAGKREPEKPKTGKREADKPKASRRGHDKPGAGKPKRRESPKGKRPSRSERVRALRTGGTSAAKGGGKALRDGAAATRRRTKAAQPKVAAAGRKSWALAAPILAIPFIALAFAERGIRKIAGIAARAISAAIAFLDRHITPGRVVLLVTIVTAGCLIASQYQDYRGVEVGQPGYIPVEATVSADQVDIETPRDAHGSWLLILAAIAIVAAVAAAVTRRRALGLAISAVGVAGLLISLLGDRPEGLDAGQTAVAYAGTNAVLLDGFYAQVAACGVLIAVGLLVALYTGSTAKRPAKSPRRARRRKPGPRPRRPLAESGA
jgi:hypothetical protein